MVRRDGHGENRGTRRAQHADTEKVLDGQEERVPIRSQNQSKRFPSPTEKRTRDIIRS